MCEGERGGGRSGDRRGPGGEPPARPPELGRHLGGSLRRSPVSADPAAPHGSRRERVSRQRLGPPLPARRRRSLSPPLIPPCLGPASSPCPSAGRCPGAAGRPSLRRARRRAAPGGREPGQPRVQAGRLRAARPAASSAARGCDAGV